MLSIFVFNQQDVGLNINESVQVVEASRSELRERYLDITVTAPVFSVDSLDQVNAVMTSLLERTREISTRAQVKSVQF